jgi:hypothetical protein
MVTGKPDPVVVKLGDVQPETDPMVNPVRRTSKAFGFDAVTTRSPCCPGWSGVAGVALAAMVTA